NTNKTNGYYYDTQAPFHSPSKIKILLIFSDQILLQEATSPRYISNNFNLKLKHPINPPLKTIKYQKINRIHLLVAGSDNWLENQVVSVALSGRSGASTGRLSSNWSLGWSLSGNWSLSSGRRLSWWGNGRLGRRSRSHTLGGNRNKVVLTRS